MITYPENLEVPSARERRLVILVFKHLPTFKPSARISIRVRVHIRVTGVPNMHLLLAILSFGAACIGIQAEETQVPLQHTSSSHISWNFFEKPSQNSTSHLIFDTVNSFLQHWTNTRYRNGQMIVTSLILLI